MKARRTAVGQSTSDRAGLWPLVVGPAAWALHFLLCYLTVAIYCAKSVAAAPLGVVQVALWLYTLLALVVITACGWRGWRQHRAGREPLPHDAGTAADRRRFMGFATFLLCALSAVAVAYTALAIAVIRTCR